MPDLMTNAALLAAEARLNKAMSNTTFWLIVGQTAIAGLALAVAKLIF